MKQFKVRTRRPIYSWYYSLFVLKTNFHRCSNAANLVFLLLTKVKLIYVLIQPLKNIHWKLIQLFVSKLSNNCIFCCEVWTIYEWTYIKLCLLLLNFGSFLIKNTWKKCIMTESILFSRMLSLYTSISQPLRNNKKKTFMKSVLYS